MSSVLRGARYIPDAVVVREPSTRGFTLGAFLTPARSEEVRRDALMLERDRLETAKLQAARIVAEAEDRATEITRESTIRGYEAGFADGLQQAEDRCRELVQRLTDLVEGALVDHDIMVRSAQREAAALALAVASKIVNREIRINEEFVLDIVRGALGRIPPAERVRVLVNPEDGDLVRERWGEAAGSSARGLEWELVTDPLVGRGGCIIEARSGFVDSRIETQMEKIIEAFEAER